MSNKKTCIDTKGINAIICKHYVLNIYIYTYELVLLWAKSNNPNKAKQIISTLDDRNGETYTLCVADTFFGDISGRPWKGEILGDPGHWAKGPAKRKHTSQWFAGLAQQWKSGI